MLFSLLVPLALAQANETIIIEAERDVVVARAVLDDEILSRGYIPLRGPHVTRYIHPQLWRPRVRLSEDGMLSIRSWRATPLTFMPAGTLMSDGDMMLSLADLARQPAVAPGVAGLWASRRTQTQMESALLSVLEAPLQDWQDAIWAHQRLIRQDELRLRMHAIWGDSARSFAERRAALLEMWLNTADNDDGQRVQEMLEVFIDETVQTSEHPLTAAEIDGANAHRPSARLLEPVPAE